MYKELIMCIRPEMPEYLSEIEDAECEVIDASLHFEEDNIEVVGKLKSK